jgi:hypothetical protein
MSYELIDARNEWDQSHMTPGREGHSIDKIVIHHMATTNFSIVPGIWNANGRAASAHFGVADGVVKRYVSEEDTAWHADNWNANLTSIGIEHVNNTGTPDWTLSEATIATSVQLVVDLMKKYKLGLDALVKHSQFAQTQCPGSLGNDANWNAYKQRVADALGGTFNPAPTPTPQDPGAGTATSDAVRMFLAGEVQWNGKEFKADMVEQVNGLWQAISFELAGATNASEVDWTLNGVPLSRVTRTNNPDQAHFNTGDTFKFDVDVMPVVKYDEATQGIMVVPTGDIGDALALGFWCDATVALNA